MERISYYNKNIKFNRKALTEVWEILNEYEDDISEIPEKYLYVIEDNMDKDYIFFADDLEDIELREDTKKIITYLYTNFLSTPEERNILKQLEQLQYKEKIKREENNQIKEDYTVFKNQYNKDKVEIEDEAISKEETINETKALVEYKENILKNILNKIKEMIKNIFRK